MKVLNKEDIQGLIKDNKIRPIDAMKLVARDTPEPPKPVDPMGGIKAVLTDAVSKQQEQSKKLLELIKDSSSTMSETSKDNASKIALALTEQTKEFIKLLKVMGEKAPQKKVVRFDVQRDENGRSKAVIPVYE